MSTSPYLQHWADSLLQCHVGLTLSEWFELHNDESCRGLEAIFAADTGLTAPSYNTLYKWRKQQEISA